MVKVSLFLRHLQNRNDLSSDLKSDITTALRNHLQNSLIENGIVTDSQLIEFYDSCVRSPYWKSNAEALWADLLEITDTLNKFPHPGSKPFSLSRQREILTLNSMQARKEIISRCLGEHYAHLKLETMGAHLLAMVQTEKRNFEAIVFDEFFAVVNGQIAPLSPVTHLCYNQRLSLDPLKEQRLRISLGNTALFRTSDDGAIRGYLVSLPKLQRIAAYQGDLCQYADLFYGIKKLEKHYVDLKTDSFYRNLVNALKQSIEVAKSNPLLARKQLKTLQKGHYTIKNILPDDELLNLLVSNLEHLINQSQTQSNIEL